MDDIKKGKILSWVIVGVIGLIAIGSTFAYLAGKEAVDIDFGASVTTNTVDSLMFTIDNDITITADMSNFTEGLDNREGSTHASAVLKANNKTNSATDHYYLYFDVTNNEFKYTTEESIPELLLQVSGPDGDLGAGDITGLNYVTVEDGQGNEISGFDITNKQDLITIASNYEITTTSEKIDKWDIKVIFVNLDADQTANGGKKFNGEVIISKEEQKIYMIKDVSNDFGCYQSICDYYSGDNEFWENRNSITKIVFEDTINPYNDATYIVDISEEGSAPIMAYLLDNGDETYTAHIQANGKIRANSNSSYLFNDFTSLENIEGLEKLDTSKVTTMYRMFYDCNKLKSIGDMSGWDTSQVTNMSDMFSRCSSLSSVGDVSGWETGKVTGMTGMFCWCRSLTSLDLSGWDTSQVTSTTSMFEGCRSLITLDMRNATFTQVSSFYGGMFSAVPSTINIYVKDEEAKTFIQAVLGSGVGTVEIA